MSYSENPSVTAAKEGKEAMEAFTVRMPLLIEPTDQPSEESDVPDLIPKLLQAGRPRDIIPNEGNDLGVNIANSTDARTIFLLEGVDAGNKINQVDDFLQAKEPMDVIVSGVGKFWTPKATYIGVTFDEKAAEQIEDIRRGFLDIMGVELPPSVKYTPHLSLFVRSRKIGALKNELKGIIQGLSEQERILYLGRPKTMPHTFKV